MALSQEQVRNIEAFRDSMQFEVGGRIEALAEELEATAKQVRDLHDIMLDENLDPNRAAFVASKLGLILRQPLGQNAQEFLLRDLANYSYAEGQLQVARS